MEKHISELVDIERLQRLMQKFTDSTGTGTAIIDLEGKTLVASGWQDICTKFHRVNKDSCKNCVESDTALANDLKAGKKYNVYNCLNGLVDAAVPIIIDKEHIGNLFIGQFLSEEPDLGYFKKQADKYGYDKKAYLKALSKVPVLSEDEVKKKMEFLSELSLLIGDMGVNKLNLVELTDNLETRIKERTRELKDAQVAALNMMQDADEARDELEITNRKLREQQEQIIKSKNMIESLVESIPGLFYQIDADGNFRKWNKQFEEVSGYSTREIAKMHPLSFFEGEDKKNIESAIMKVFVEGYSEVEADFCSKNGEKYPCLFTGKLVEIDNEQFLIGAGLDVSKLKEVEADLQKLNEDLNESNEQLERFAYIASHDLQEPLRKIKSFSDLLFHHIQNDLDEKGIKYMNYVTSGAVRMQQLITDLLQFSRISTRGKPFEITEMDKVIERALDSVSLQIKERNAQIKIDDMPRLKADNSQMTMLMQNLIHNGIKFCDKNEPMVRISFKDHEDEWEFTVTDNGIGIEPEYHDRIFIIFQRLHGKSSYQGTGIGLAVCKKIVERHGGKIWVESTLGEGSTFHFTIKKNLKD